MYVERARLDLYLHQLLNLKVWDGKLIEFEWKNKKRHDINLVVENRPGVRVAASSSSIDYNWCVADSTSHKSNPGISHLAALHRAFYDMQFPAMQII
jgi:hypothetical protein